MLVIHQHRKQRPKLSTFWKVKLRFPVCTSQVLLIAILIISSSLPMHGPKYSQYVATNFTALHLAAYFDLANIIKLLLNNGHDPYVETRINDLHYPTLRSLGTKLGNEATAICIVG